jgi:biotin transport system substrate-specific component
MAAIQFESRLIDITNHNQTLKNIMSMILGSFLLAIFSQITIPLNPVPITMQTFGAFMIAMLFGPKMGSKIILLYLCEGLCGLPVFANFASGAHVLFGPTGGYLLGFIPAVILIGYLLEIGCAKNRLTILLAALLGTIVLFIPGYLLLAKFVGFHNAYQLGVMPFYIIEAGKLIIFTAITPFFWRQKTQHEHF